MVTLESTGIFEQVYPEMTSTTEQVQKAVLRLFSEGVADSVQFSIAFRQLN